MSTNINSKEEACQVLRISTNATEKEIDKAYKQLANKFHPDKYKYAWGSNCKKTSCSSNDGKFCSDKCRETFNQFDKKFKEIGAAKAFLDNYSSNSESDKLEEHKTEVKRAIAKKIGEEGITDEELGEWKDWEDKINKMKTMQEIISYCLRFNDWFQKRTKKKKKAGGGTSSKGTDSGYSSDSSDYSSSKQKYYKPFTCDYCFYAVPSTDSRPKITAEGKQFCKRSCANSYIQREYDKAEHEKRMNQIREDIRKSDEKHQERMRKFDEETERRRKEREESDKKWRQKMEEQDKKRDQRSKDFNKNLAEDAIREAINSVNSYINLYEASEQQVNEWLGKDWKEQISNSSSWREAYRKRDDYNDILGKKKVIAKLARYKEKVIEWIEYHLDLYKLEDQQLNEALDYKDWREEVNRCSNREEVSRKNDSLERKVKKINNDPHRKRQTPSSSINNLDYSQQNYVEKQLSLPSGQSVNEYIRSAKTPEERKQREDEVRTILNKLEQENRKTRAVASIVGVLLIGTIIGLIIYLVKRNKKRY